MDTRMQVKQTVTGRRLTGAFFALLAGVLLISFPASDAVAEDKPYNLDAESRIDWYTFNGYRRYHAVCHTCHGPAGLGGSFAPSLLDAFNKKGLTYERYFEVVVNGLTTMSTTAQSSMPSFATDPNVMCFVDDIYAYLVARADGVLGTNRPANKQPKPAAAKERDDVCLGS